MGIGKLIIESGMADVMLVGGAEAPICPLLFAAFDRLEMMPTHFNDSPDAASRPFSADREGFVLGEGAAIMVMEREDLALERGARPLARVAGYSATCDAFHHFSQDPNRADAVRAVIEALQMAQVAPASVDYVNAHGSGTLINDPFETAVLHDSLGDHASVIPVSSTKSMLGHLMGASPAVEVAATVAAMDGGFVPPTLNLSRRDPECDLDYVPHHSRVGEIGVAISTSFGFGSRNAAVVVRRYSDGAGPRR